MPSVGGGRGRCDATPGFRARAAAVPAARVVDRADRARDLRGVAGADRRGAVVAVFRCAQRSGLVLLHCSSAILLDLASR